MQLPIVLGISPDSLFLDKSSVLRAFRLSNSIGRFPVKELCERLSNSESKERSAICLGIA